MVGATSSEVLKLLSTADRSAVLVMCLIPRIESYREKLCLYREGNIRPWASAAGPYCLSRARLSLLSPVGQ